jgi:hypothetical protein
MDDEHLTEKRSFREPLTQQITGYPEINRRSGWRRTAVYDPLAGKTAQLLRQDAFAVDLEAVLRGPCLRAPECQIRLLAGTGAVLV